MGPLRSLKIPKKPYRAVQVLEDPTEALWGPFRSLKIPQKPYGVLQVLEGPTEALWDSAPRCPLWPQMQGFGIPYGTFGVGGGEVSLRGDNVPPPFYVCVPPQGPPTHLGVPDPPVPSPQCRHRSVPMAVGSPPSPLSPLSRKHGGAAVSSNPPRAKNTGWKGREGGAGGGHKWRPLLGWGGTAGG